MLQDKKSKLLDAAAGTHDIIDEYERTSESESTHQDLHGNDKDSDDVDNILRDNLTTEHGPLDAEDIR